MDTLSLTMDCGLLYADAQSVLDTYEDGENETILFDLENFDYGN